ncbi:pilus assembly protein [Cohnella lubricantis]|uniref:Pilus assembly protein n=1 Tax=Cohnella lubricantis TaxID=2163172 RepID=A0A841TCL6_9BACL|nr:pilus assembly protein [Cohnella lubricantis]MBB6677108.1 pilus assembly protein [Cohnella lubricantis]MBP2118955.1 hypothetical protein [Cohnella lubricantis]
MYSLKRIAAAARRLQRDSAGSATLDASLTFPIILLMTFLLLFFAIYMAQGAIRYYSASIAGERAAFSWNNSAKDLRTGAYPEGSFDGLYWRLLDDGMLAGLFGMSSSEEEGVGVGFGDSGAGAEETEGDSLTRTKLQAAADMLSSSLDGRMNYTNKLLERRIEMEAYSSMAPEPLRSFLRDSQPSAQPSAVVVEPTEFIRSFDLVRYYTAKMKGAKEGEASLISKAKSVLLKRQQAG